MKIIFIIFLFLQIFFSIPYLSAFSVGEYDCIGNLTTHLGISSSYRGENGSGLIDYCSYTTNFDCNFDGNFEGLYFSKQSSSNEINSSFLLCFPFLKYLYLETVNVNEDILYTKLPSILEISLINCVGSEMISREIQPLDYLYLENKSRSTFTVPLSWIQNIGNFSFYSSITPYPLNSTFYRDENVTNFNTLKYFAFSTNIIPNLTGFSCGVDMLLGFAFQQSSLPNLKTFTNITDLMIWQHTVEMNFPNDLFTLTQLEYFTIGFNFRTPSKAYDFSNFTKLIYIEILDTSYSNFGSKFFPISKIPTGLKEFHYYGPLKSLPTSFEMFKDITIFNVPNDGLKEPLKSLTPSTYPKITELKFSDNLMYGTIPPEYCNTLPVFSNNNLTGLIPNCFTCFFNDTDSTFWGQTIVSRFANNNFYNFNNPGPCISMIPNLSLENNDKLLKIYGESLGSNPKIITTNVTGTNTDFQVVKINSIFTLDLNLYSSLNIYKNGSRSIKLTWNVGKEKREFTLAIVKQAPIPSNFTYYSSLNDVTINGEFFTYNVSDVFVNVGNIECVVNKSTFNQIICKPKSALPLGEFIFSDITVAGNKTNFFLKLSSSLSANNNKKCNPELCSSNTYCNLDDGICYPFLNCDSRCALNGGYCLHGTGKCNCKNDCSNKGACDVVTGTCSCEPGRLFDDCSGIQCPGSPDVCSGHGSCDTSNGKCKCSSITWVGDDCFQSQHYASSILACSEIGGPVLFYGFFGSLHNNLSVVIGSATCNVSFVSDAMINCTLGPGKGTAKPFIYQNGLEWSSDAFLFKYTRPQLTCPKDCTSTANGNCNISTGICTCIGNYTGLDCGSFASIPGGGQQSNTTVDEGTGSGTINTGNVDYTIFITSLLEIGFDGSTINEYDLLSNWKLNSSAVNGNGQQNHVFSQFIGTDGCSIISNIEEVSSDKQYEFAGVNFKVVAGSIKVSLKILNFPFQSTLNTLQIRMKSSVFNNTNQPQKCSNGKESQLPQDERTIVIDSNDFSNENDNLNYITITKNNKKMYGRFLSKILSDGRPTFITSTIVSTSLSDITIGMNLPHCASECVIDPDFSVLLDTEQKEESTQECVDDKQNSGIDTKKIIIIAVVGGVAGLAILGAAGYLIYRKKFVEVFPSTQQTKLRNLK